MSENHLKIVGISVRTTNAAQQAIRDMAALWERFYTEQVFEKIPHKLSNHIYSVYTDYNSDYTDAYTAIVGVPVSKIEPLPEGFVARVFDNEHFAVFTAKGQMPKAVMDAWHNIWQLDAKLHRKYTYDFEVYGEKAQNPDEPEVDIYVAVHCPKD